MFNVRSPRALRLNNSFQRYIKALSVSLMLLSVGCTRERSLPAELSMKVEPSDRPGVYIVSGQTNVSDQSRIIVQGIRPFTASAQSTSTDEAANYSILDRQAVVVTQGKWQATLKLWQSTPDGQGQEAWQANQPQISQLQPSADVVFVAAIDSASQPKALLQPLDNQGKKLEGANIRFTTDGQWYLQAKQTLTVTPPIYKATPLELNANDSSGDRSRRSELSSALVKVTSINLPIPKEKQTTAPLSFSQRLR